MWEPHFHRLARPFLNLYHKHSKDCIFIVDLWNGKDQIHWQAPSSVSTDRMVTGFVGILFKISEAIYKK